MLFFLNDLQTKSNKCFLLQWIVDKIEKNAFFYNELQINVLPRPFILNPSKNVWPLLMVAALKIDLSPSCPWKNSSDISCPWEYSTDISGLD